VSDQLLWFATRGAGIVSLILLTVVAVFGLISVTGWQRPGWPRFLSADLHNNLALLSVAFVAVHVITAIIDPFTALGISAAVIPFASSYRPLWVGLGVISVYAVIAMIATSLLREHIGQRAWRLVHWLAYAGWPLAVAHSLGAGSDAFAGWFVLIAVVCMVSVIVALSARIWLGRPRRADLPLVVAESRLPAPFVERRG
jgi:methionine sulfoxide reductase heme-binding subunit